MYVPSKPIQRFVLKAIPLALLGIIAGAATSYLFFDERWPQVVDQRRSHLSVAGLKWPAPELGESGSNPIDDTGKRQLDPILGDAPTSTSRVQEEGQTTSSPALMDAPLKISPQRIVMTVMAGQTGQQTVTISNQSKHHQFFQIRIETLEHWLRFQPTELSIAPGGIEKLTVSCETRWLDAGDYTATVKLVSPLVSELEEVTLPVELSVHPSNAEKPPLRGLGAPNRPAKTAQPIDDFATSDGEDSADEAQEMEDDEPSNDDEIVFEAEDALFMNPTFVVLSDTSASNSEYITPLNGLGNGIGEVGYRFQIQKTGIYKVIGRVRALVDGDDSFYVRMDYGRRYFWELPESAGWIWRDVSNGWARDEVNFELEAGEHTLRIENREDGAMLDIVVISRVSD